ncbi:Kinetochore-associated protein 1 [Phytophthora citrophthora]|uniref:Kinetochore-associated protein 1 n=1 Tax=Phytophthora citrophthora TaxID=4793 RepID=A0AAD9GTL3_9STRA|nr:Kinetochore-associated protein 1 [Phytophthora citrophthora]
MLEKYIKLGSMRAVRILWGRHYDSTAVGSIGKLLQYLPTSLPVSAFASWIQSELIPTLIRHEQAEVSSTETNDPPVLIEVVLWLIERSEAAASKGDLDTAIRICDLLKIDDTRGSMDGGELSFYEFKLENSMNYAGEHGRGAFERIERLAEKLRHVKRLAVEHQFIISLSVFEDETPATIAMSMLDRVLDPESLQKEIEDHVRTYLEFSGIAVDPVLHDYVTELAESIQSPESAVEARILVLLDEIRNPDVRANATLALLRSVLPPYSPTLKNYANSCSQWKTERLEEIEEHVRLMEIQDMLTKYGIKQFDVADTKSASRLVSHILNQVSKPTALTDAMLLVDAYSDLHCDRAVARYTENLLSDLDATCEEVPDRVVKAMDALTEVKKRKELKAHLELYVALLEETIEFGVTLLEMEAEEMEVNEQGHENGQSFVLCMLKALVTAYLDELKTILEIMDTAPDSVVTYVESSDYLLSDKLLSDLQRICQIESDYRVLLSIKLLRDPEECEKKFKQLINPKILFEDDEDQEPLGIPVIYAGRGKGKKRAVASNGQGSLATKRQRTGQDIGLQSRSSESQQNDERTRLLFNLNRFASVVGIDAKVYQSFIAQSAATSGSILQAIRFSRDLYSRRSFNVPIGSARHPAEALKKIAISFSLYTSSHVKDIYDVAFTRNQKLLPAQVARVQAPIYTLELLRHALCMCEEESFDELLILLKNTMLVNEILQFTQHNSLAKSEQGQWELYPRWYRGDACALDSYEAMKLVTRFAIAEHKNLRREVEDRDTIASKRYVSFLVEQRADLLSLQALMAMQELPDDAASVVNTQMGKLLSTVFQSQEIDNYLALGLMLSMKQEDAFHAFRKQISRENVAKDFNRFQQLAFIGADAARAWQQIAFLHQCVELEGNARWWHYLNLLGIECDHKAFQNERRDLQYIRHLVPTLLTRSNYDFYTVLEFTRHYQIEDSFPSLVYTEALLLGDFPGYQDKIAGVIDEIHEQHLMKLLLKSVTKASGEDYDRLLFIFRLLLENTSYRERKEVERRMEVLKSLKAFAHQISGSKNGENRDKISFHELLAEPAEVLARVVTKENFSALIGFVDPLRLEPDQLHMLLLKNMTSDLKREGTTSLQFSAFEGILTCLSDTENRVTAAEWLAKNFPLGDDKLKALEFALKSAVSGQNGAGDPANTSFTGHEALTRLENKILRVKVEMLLRNATTKTSSLAEIINDKEQTNQLLVLVAEPKKLYLELYRRYALRFYTGSSDMLHEVAGSIGELLRLPQAQLRLELVRGWLVKDAVQIGKGDSNEAKEDPFELLEAEKLQQADDDFGKRILYVVTSSVKAGDEFGEQVLRYLVDFAKDSRPLAGVTYRAKMRALRVILRLGQLDHGALERFVATKYGIENSDPFFKELLEYTKHCTHLVTFEEHRVPYDMTFVLKSDKEVLTRSFLRRFSLKRPWVLRCTSQLMLDFDIDAPDLWEDILTSMLELGMLRSLAGILGPLSRKSFVRSLACARQVWEDVLTLPLIDLKNRHQPHETEELCFAGVPIVLARSVMERMVLLLERCPFLDQIDVPAFVVHLRDLAAIAQESHGLEIAREMGLHEFAVKCAMVIPKPLARFEALMRIIQSGAHSAVLQELLDISCFLDGECEESGELADNYRLIQVSFAEAAKREDHASILSTPFESGFIEYLAATGDIDFLLSLL